MRRPFVSCTASKMSKQLKNMVEAAQPPTPPVSTFIQYVEKLLVGESATVRPENRLFAESFPEEEAKKEKSKNSHIGARVAIDYEKVQSKAGLEGTITEMDDWLCGLAKFVILPELLLDDPVAQADLRARRQTLCKDVCNPRFLTCSSFRGYVNALFKSIKELKGPAMVSSCTKSFPRFNDLMNCAVKKYAIVYAFVDQNACLRGKKKVRNQSCPAS